MRKSDDETGESPDAEGVAEVGAAQVPGPAPDLNRRLYNGRNSQLVREWLRRERAARCGRNGGTADGADNPGGERGSRADDEAAPRPRENRRSMLCQWVTTFVANVRPANAEEILITATLVEEEEAVLAERVSRCQRYSKTVAFVTVITSLVVLAVALMVGLGGTDSARATERPLQSYNPCITLCGLHPQERASGHTQRCHRDHGPPVYAPNVPGSGCGVGRDTARPRQRGRHADGRGHPRRSGPRGESGRLGGERVLEGREECHPLCGRERHAPIWRDLGRGTGRPGSGASEGRVAVLFLTGVSHFSGGEKAVNYFLGLTEVMQQISPCFFNH